MMLAAWTAELSGLKQGLTDDELSELAESRGYECIGPYGFKIYRRYWQMYRCDRYPCMRLYVEFEFESGDPGEGTPKVSRVRDWKIADMEAADAILANRQN